MKIALPVQLKAWVEEQVADGHFASASEYVRKLILADAKAKAQEKLEALLLEGLEGEATEWTEADWQELKRRAAGGAGDVHDKAQPFEPLTPNAETIAALREARAGGLEKFASIEDLLEDLNKED